LKLLRDINIRCSRHSHDRGEIMRPERASYLMIGRETISFADAIKKSTKCHYYHSMLCDDLAHRLPSPHAG